MVSDCTYVLLFVDACLWVCEACLFLRLYVDVWLHVFRFRLHFVLPCAAAAVLLLPLSELHSSLVEVQIVHQSVSQLAIVVGAVVVTVETWRC